MYKSVSNDRYFLDWHEAFFAGEVKVGGKGWNLSRLARYGFRIPKGGVLVADAYILFLEENNLRELIEDIGSEITLDNIHTAEVNNQLEQIRKRIKGGTFPPYIQKMIKENIQKLGIIHSPLAVRSSATVEDSEEASFAGIHHTSLNVIGLDNIFTAVKNCYASLWTEAAVAYRRNMKIGDKKLLPAVVMMEMVNAKGSGVAFTCDPKTGREDIIVVNANFGLGESVVGGNVEPDVYYLDGEQYLPRIKNKAIGKKEGLTIPLEDGGTKFVEVKEQASKQVLTDSQILDLGMLVQRVYYALNRRKKDEQNASKKLLNQEVHQDIEWVFDGKEFIIVQARPVTVLPRYDHPEVFEYPDVWSNSNFRDGLPMVQSTLNWCLIKNGLNTLFRVPFEEVGHLLPEGLKTVRLYEGRAYLNMTRQQWYSFDCFGVKPEESKISYGGHQREIGLPIENSFKGREGLKRIWRTLKLTSVMNKTVRRANEFYDDKKKLATNLLKKDFATYDDRKLISTISNL